MTITEKDMEEARTVFEAVMSEIPKYKITTYGLKYDRPIKAKVEMYVSR